MSANTFYGEILCFLGLRKMRMMRRGDGSMADRMVTSILDEVHAKGEAKVQAISAQVNGRTVVVASTDRGGFEIFVPVSDSASATTTLHALESWAAMDMQWNKHPNMPKDHIVVARRGQVTVSTDNNNSAEIYTPDETRALAWELLSAADKAQEI